MSRTSLAPRPGPPVGRARLARRSLLLAPALLLLSGCTGDNAYEKAFSLGFPEPVTEQGREIYNLWLGSVAAASIVGILVAALIMFAAVKYRKTGEQLPRQVRYNLPIEVLYTAVPFVIIAVLFYYTTVSQNFVNKLTPAQEGGAEVNIGVVGFQWNWTFRYEDAKVQTTGSTITPNTLVLPVGQKIRFTETSPDVIHSFFVPAFLFKRDVVPGRANTFEVTITKAGQYIGRCAELCGEKHSAMNFVVKAVSPADYQAYVTGLQADPGNAILDTTGTGAVQTTRTAE